MNVSRILRTASAMAVAIVLGACSGHVPEPNPVSTDERESNGGIRNAPGVGAPPQCAPCGGSPTTRKDFFNWP